MPAPSVTSDKHKKLVALIKNRRAYSERFFEGRHSRWRESEKSFRGYVEAKKAKDPNAPWLRKLFVPVTPLLIQTQLSFDMAAFTQRQPIVGLDPTGPEDVTQVKVMEAYLEWEWHKKLMLTELWGWLVDRRRYGIGIMWNRWTNDMAFRTRREKRTVELPFLGIKLAAPDVKTREEYVKYEGNEAHVQDPFNFGFDPRVTAARVQEGEWVYRIIRRSWSHMKENERGEDPLYTNVDAIPKGRESSVEGVSQVHFQGETIGFARSDSNQGSDRHEIVGLTRDSQSTGKQADPKDKGYVELTEMVIKLIPRDYEIGEEDVPTMYWVVMANDSVIVRADPFDYDHQQFPCSIIESNPDPHSVLNISSTEELAEMQKYANWLYRSRAEHVIRTLNGQFLADPSKIHVEDLLTPQPGNIVRIKPDAFNIPGGLRDAFMQLPVQDVTRGHVEEIGNIMTFLEKLSAATEALQGVPSQEAKTATEIGQTTQGAQGRLRVQAQLAWNQGMIPWSVQRMANVQQLLENEKYVRVVGGMQDALGVPPDKRFVHISPDELTGCYDVQPIDGIVRGDGQLLAAWTQILTQILNSPEVASRYDVNGIMKFVATLSGVKNLDQFELKQAPMIPGPGAGSPIQVISDEDAARRAASGDLIPADQAVA